MYILIFLEFIQKWKIGKINHVAIATPDMGKASDLFRDVLGAKVSEKHVSIFISFSLCLLGKSLNKIIK